MKHKNFEQNISSSASLENARISGHCRHVGMHTSALSSSSVAVDS